MIFCSNLYVARSVKIKRVCAQNHHILPLYCHNSHVCCANKTKMVTHMQKFMENFVKFTE